LIIGVIPFGCLDFCGVLILDQVIRFIRMGAKQSEKRSLPQKIFALEGRRPAGWFVQVACEPG
jgi:hypothetical protein